MSDEESKAASREERVQAMRDMLDQLKTENPEALTPQQAEELVRWASVEHAAVYHLISQAQRVMRSLHPSTHSDPDKLDTEASMYLLEAAAQLSKECAVPKDLLVKGLMVYLGEKNTVAPPDAAEADDFDKILYGSSN